MALKLHKGSRKRGRKPFYLTTFFHIFLLHPNELVSNLTRYIYILLAILNYEEDVAMYTIKVANDPRTHNRIVVYRPSKNFITQNELI
ncbi:phenylcoumaran benzylic ether reductase-like protein, putative [Medicago truncatula]|uniref:Phenylcoumaran benzylic ether reductase-like protein, putative n=1 Tax=Medicago truncatula TaxID=3880 RepID=G7IVJ2_MEDTR|nr:phenylcoumaran benzylic ether reductase-like protein, putative [Medicago truncatula]